MIPLKRPTPPAAPVIKVLGLGGAGCSALDRLVLDGIEGAAVIALNTDVQALNGCVAPQKIHLGRNATRGLGAGGDPEIGYEAAEEAGEEIKAAIAGAEMIFLCTGLGGGTGSGAAPLIAHMARGAGAMVVAFATLPFSFEGKRRRKQAADALAQLEEQADLVVCFENDRLGETASPTAGVQQAFVAADQILSHSMSAIAAIIRRGGIIPTSLAELSSALRRAHPRCLFGYGESDGANRAHEALARALKSPLMDKGKTLADCHSVVIHIAGGPDITVQEITTLMEEFNRHISDDTRIDFGIGTDAKLGRRMCVTIISSTGAAEAAAAPAPVPVPVQRILPSRAPAHPPQRVPSARTPQRIAEPAPVANEALDFDDEEETQPALLAEPERIAPVKAAPESALYKTQKATAEKVAAGKKEEKAEQMSLEPANRGRFEKSEPTIVDGQDLDVPTFLRKNLKVK
jgi:cell division protein FtsZ